MDIPAQFTVAASTLSFVLQVLAVVYAYRVGKKLGHSTFWWFLIAALGLQASRRIIAIGYELGSFGDYAPLVRILDSNVIPLIASAFFLAGMYSLYRRLQAHEFVDRPVKRS